MPPKATAAKGEAPKKATIKADDVAAAAAKGEGAAKRAPRKDDDDDVMPVLPDPYPPKRERPDNTVFERQLRDLVQQINAKREEMKNTPMPASPEQDKIKDLEGKRKELQSEIDTLSAEIKDAEQDKARLQPLVREARQKEQDNLKLLKARGGKSSKPVDIDTEILRLEVMFQTSGKGGRDAERANEKRIAELKAIRAQMDTGDDLEKNQAALRDESKSVQEQLANVSETLSKLLPQRHALFTQRDELKKELDAVYAAARANRASTQTPLQKEVAALQDRITSLKAESARQWAEWKAFVSAERLRSKKEYLERKAARAKADEERAARIAAREAARAREDEERKAKDEERRKAEITKRIDPHHEEAVKCEKLVGYLINRRSMGGPAVVVGAGAGGAAKTGPGVAKSDKLKALVRKTEDDEGDLFEGEEAPAKPTARKGRGGGGGGGARGPAKQALRHAPQILGEFKAVGVEPPATFEAIDASIEEIKKRRAHFESFKKSEADIEQEMKEYDEKRAAERAERAKKREEEGGSPKGKSKAKPFAKVSGGAAPEEAADAAEDEDSVKAVDEEKKE